MFLLSKLEADVRVAPKDLVKPPLAAVTEVLEADYLDRVIPDLGLVVSIYDVISLEGGHIYPNDGAAFFRVVFRLAVFRPFVGEVLVGTILSSSKQGVRVGLGFFEDVHVPDYALQDPSFFDASEGVWKWSWEGNEMYMDHGETVRFRVTGVRFNPLPPPAATQAAQARPGDDAPLGTSARPFSPMEVLGDMCGDGLGLTAWWDAAGDEGGDEEMAEGADG